MERWGVRFGMDSLHKAKRLSYTIRSPEYVKFCCKSGYRVTSSNKLGQRKTFLCLGTTEN